MNEAGRVCSRCGEGVHEVGKGVNEEGQGMDEVGESVDEVGVNGWKGVNELEGSVNWVE